MHGRQRGIAAQGPGAVVEADDPHVVGHASTRLAEGLDRAGGDGIARGEDAVDVGDPVEKTSHSGLAVGERVERHPLDELGVEVAAQRVDEPREAVGAGVAVERGGDHADATPTGADEAFRDVASGAAVVDRDVGGVADVARVADEGGGETQLDDRARDGVAHARRHDDHAVDETAAEVARETVHIARGVGDEARQLVVGLGERAVGAEQDRRDVGVFDEQRVRFVHDEPDRLGALHHEAARRAVGDEPDPRDRRLDRGARVFRHVRLAVEHATDRAPRDARLEGDVLHGGATTTLRFHVPDPRGDEPDV